MPTIPLYFHHMLTLGDRFDRPDAPAGAAPDFTPQIVFKLFIEIPGSTLSAATPFTTLFTAVINRFPNPQVLTFDALTQFLAAFQFDLLPATQITQPMTMTLTAFPMLPYMVLTPPAPASPIDFSTRKPCTAAYLQSLTDPFAVRKPQPAASATPDTPQTFPSLAAGMFTDYFLTAIQHLGDKPGDFAAAAKAAGLFLMHSIRLPDPDAPGPQDYPLFVLSGQQLTLPADTSSGYAVNLAPTHGAHPKLSFPGANGAFSFEIGKLAAQFVPADRILALSQSEPFAVTKRRFALADPVLTPTNRIYGLPPTLRGQLESSPVPAGLDLTLLLSGASATAAPVPASGYLWATRINFTIRQVASPNAAGQPLPAIYEIAGMDTGTRDDLLSFLISPQARAGSFDVSLLYAADPASPGKGQKSDPIQAGEVWVVKSNLSTQAHTAVEGASSSADLPGPSPDSSEAGAFLKLLWEASLVSTGGFYLFYGHGTGLPAALFGQTGTATVTVMVVPQQKIAAQPFHNCVVCGVNDDAAFIDPPVYTVAPGGTLKSIAGKLSTTVEALVSANASDPRIPATGKTIPASSGQKAYVIQPYDSLLSLALRYESQPLGTQTLHTLWTALLAALPDDILTAGAILQIPGWVASRPTVTPGAIGFRAVANPPLDALQKLYCFLGTEIRGLGSSGPLRGLPAGPQTTGPNATGVNPFYRQILYIAGANPYSLIGQSATLALQYQDAFGNHCLPVTQALGLQFQIQYRDPLIGLSQWPGTSVSYDFASGPQIVFTLAFETKRYLPAEGASLDSVLTRAAGDLERYKTIAFQIGQPKIRFEVQTSLAGASIASDALRDACCKHASDVCTFLGSVGQLQKKTAAVTHSDLASLAAQNNVSVSDLATVNQNVANLLGGAVRQLQIPVQYAVNRNETLAGIAFRHSVTVAQLAADNQDVANLFLLAVTIPGQSSPFQPESGATPASIASANNVTVEQLFAANQNSPNLLTGSLLTTGFLAYSVQPNDTLSSVARAQGVTIALLAMANQSQAILNTSDPSIQIEIPVPPVLPFFTAASPIGVAVSPAITSTVTPVSISIVIARPDGSVDGLFADPTQFAAIQAVQTEIRPDAAIGQNSDALRSLAGRFEAAFAAFELRLALGPDHAGTVLATSAQRLYAIRFPDAAPLFQIGSQARFYAPPPLLNTGWTGSIAWAGATVTFTNVDLDAWAREFVATLDLLLSPAYAAALHASTNSATYQTLASAKATIAQAMSLAVMPIFADNSAAGANLLAAQEALLERVLVQLQEFYKVDAIVQFSVATRYTGDEEAGNVPARLSGNLSGTVVSGTATAKPDFTLSGATIDLGQTDSELTFVLHLASSSPFPDLKLNLQFTPGAVELASAFQGTQLAPGYEAFDQLLLLPSSLGQADPPFATVDIPMPLRAYPLPPALISQQVVQNLPAKPSLADLKVFQYQFSFSYATAGQDQLQIGLTTLPTAVSPPTTTVDATPSTTADALPQALAQWAAFANAQSVVLSGLLDAPPTADSIAAAKVFASVADTIAAAWSTRTTQPAQRSAPPLPQASTVTQNPASPGQQLVTVTSIAPPDPLNVISVQSILGSLQVTRNGMLANTPVNPQFVYHVPAQFPTAIVPLFRDDNPIDIAALPVPAFVAVQDQLRRQIVTLIANLLDASPATPPDNLPNLRIGVSFEFALATASGAQAAMPALVARTPVALLPRFDFDPAVDLLGDTGVCARVASELVSWHKREASGPGTWVFDISLYSNVTPDSFQPLLELTNLRAPATS